jgi:hypothetical protein
MPAGGDSNAIFVVPRRQVHAEPEPETARRMYIGDLLGLAEGLGKRGFFLNPHASNLMGEERLASLLL